MQSHPHKARGPAVVGPPDLASVEHVVTLAITGAVIRSQRPLSEVRVVDAQPSRTGQDHPYGTGEGVGA